MKRIIVIWTLIIFGMYVSAQNLLPTVWQISFADTTKSSKVQFESHDWQRVNMYLSWERQGFSGMFGKCCFTTSFQIPLGYNREKYSLKLGLHCDVSEVYINNILVCRNLPNNFWRDKHSSSTFAIPNSCLRAGKDNRIEIFASGLSYTGGKSYNTCSLTPNNNAKQESVKIDIPKKDHLFNIGEKDIVLRIKYASLTTGLLTLCINNDFHDTILTKTYTVNPKDNLLKINVSRELTKCGFYECTATMHSAGYSCCTQWLALSPEKITCKKDTTIAHTEYWRDALNELKSIAPNFKIHKVDSLSTGIRDGYVVEMQSMGNLTIRGYYFVPRTAGKHAVVMQVPGYGYGFQNLASFINSTENVAELALCVRGHGISADVFNPGFGIPGIWGYKLNSKTDNAYRSIYMDCVRAVEFLTSRQEIDSTRIGVMGGSQGGGLTLATAGLCGNKIAACAYFDPFPCDQRDVLKIRTICNFELKSYLRYYNNPCSFEEALAIQDLIDSKDMAARIKCPVFFATGLFDDDCPPHIGFSAYNNIHAQKQFKIYPNDSHLGESNHEKEFWEFFKHQLNF